MRRWFSMGTVLPWFSLQPHGDVARHPPAVGAGRDETLFLHPAGKVTALPCAPRPVAPSGPAWWDTCLNPTRNMSVPDGHRQKKCWFNFCSKGQRSPLTDPLARRCRASLQPRRLAFACFGWQRLPSEMHFLSYHNCGYMVGSAMFWPQEIARC